MSASAWDRAVDLAARAMVMEQSNGCCDRWPKPCLDCDCFRDQHPDVMAGYERAHAHSALAAAVPVLLEELAQRIEARKTPYAVPGDNEWNGGLFYGAEIVRGFAAEVTK